ncbi:LRIF1 factor, partial [Sapayoa aenigma]|nr:LRIF1 factor [Sapayoa aenigma]
SSIAGCMYRVLQTTGPDGKNLLKLLPISKAVQSPAMPNNPKGNIPTPVHLAFKTQLGNSAAPSSVQIFQSPNPRNIILTRTLDKQEGVRAGSEKESSLPSGNMDRAAVQNTAVSSSSQQGSAAVMVVNTSTLPVAVKSPALPSGHHLQIPADAEVKSVPASLLPPAIQQKILVATTNSVSGGADGAKIPSVIYVSPVNTVKSPSVLPKQFQAFCPKPSPEVSKALIVTATPKGSGTHPDASEGQQRRQAPIKWIVQEAAALSTPCLIPVKSSNNVASKILKTLSDTKNVEANSANILPLCSGGNHPKLAPLKDNALVMYNGKVYLLTKRGSDVLVAQADKPPPPVPEDSLKKEPPKQMDAAAVNKISSKVVNLVLSKSKGVVLSQKDPKPCPDSRNSSWSDSKCSPAALGTPSAERQDLSVIQRQSVSSSGDIPAPAGGTQRCVWKSGKAKGQFPQGVSPQGEPEGAPDEDWPKIQWEKMDSPGKAVQDKPQEQPHWKQYLELRKKFGLVKEERVNLRRIPLIQDPKEDPEETDRSSGSSSSLDVEITNRQECGKEEKVFVDVEEDLTRKRKIKSSPLSDSGKRRRTLAKPATSPGLEASSSSALPRNVSPPPASPEPSIPTGSSGSSQRRDSEPDTPPQSNSWDSGLPVLGTLGEDPSLLEGSFRDDAFPAAPPDLDETIRDEKIRRLKQLLREREAALEQLRRE